jgi:DNA-binding beta-propeller fold protein YncE
MTLPLLLTAAAGLLLPTEAPLPPEEKTYLKWVRHVEVGRTPSFLLFGPKSRDLYVACVYDTAVVRLDTSTFAKKSRARLSPVSPLPLALPPAESTLLVGNYAANTVLWVDPKSGEVEHSLEVDFKPTAMALTRDGRRLAVSCDRAQAVFQVDVKERSIEGEPVVLNGPPHGLVFDAKGSRLYAAYGGENPGLAVLPKNGSHEFIDLEVAQQPPLLLSRDGKHLLVPTTKAGGCLQFLEVRKLEEVRSIPVEGRIYALAEARKGRSLAVLLSGEVVLLDSKTGKELQRVEVGRAATDLKVSADGRWLVVANRSAGTVSFFEFTR